MKKFKYVFFICLSVLLSIGLYVGKSENFEINIVDNSYFRQETSKAMGVESFAMGKRVGNKDNVILSVLDNNINIVFEPITLNDNDDKYIYNIGLKNDSSNVVNTVIKCDVSDNRYIDIYTDKNLYVIDKESTVSVKIIIKLKNKKVIEDLDISYSCSVVSTSN